MSNLSSMEAVMVPDQSVSSYKSQMRTTKKGVNRSFISRPSDNSPPLNSHVRFLQALPPYLSHSYPPFSLQQQPPLLPLPMSRPPNPITQPPVRGLSCPPTNRKSNNNSIRTRHSSLTPKKSKPSATSPKKKENLKPIAPVAKISPSSESDQFLVSSINPLGPDPNDLPKDVPKTLSLSLSGNSSISTYGFGSHKAMKGDQFGGFSGSVAFTLSPPPSSLPLPTFSLRPKLSCNAEAAGIDAGATDNLRRLLRLR